MHTTYDVRIWKIERRKRTTGTTYRVLWRVGDNRHRLGFKLSAQAESFRADLFSAASRGEAFRVNDGLPVSFNRPAETTRWFEFACDYMDFKWSNASPGHRRNAAEALATVTLAMVSDARGRPDDKTIRATMIRAVNPTTRANTAGEAAAQWLKQNTVPVAELEDNRLVHAVLAKIGATQDGDKAAPSTFRRKRMTLTNALDYAVESRLLRANPLPRIKSGPAAGKAIRAIDTRSVVNPYQARTLLRAVTELGSHGQRTAAFFACMYFAALRPEESAMLARQNLVLPESGWGVIYLESAAPEMRGAWTDSGKNNERRELKHRERGETRQVPCAPELVRYLRQHLSEFGTAPDGRLFHGSRAGGRLGSSVYGRVWAVARDQALTPEVAASPLAKRPYDLRHACVSTWLAAGVPPATVAMWAGHSVGVLLQVYAKCLNGTEHLARGQVEAFLNGRSPRERMGNS